jgi:hypothetical protein
MRRPIKYVGIWRSSCAHLHDAEIFDAVTLRESVADFMASQRTSSYLLRTCPRRPNSELMSSGTDRPLLLIYRAILVGTSDGQVRSV